MNRRTFLRRTAIAGAAGVIGSRRDYASAEPTPETTRIRRGKYNAVCTRPQFIAGELLRAEGFTDTQYVTRPGIGVWSQQAVANGEIDIGVGYATNVIRQIDRGD